MAHVLLHGIKFLFLIIVEQGLDAVVGAFGDGAHLAATVFLGERLILEERLHLLLAFDEQGFDFVLLVRTQVQFAGEAGKLAIGIHAHAAAAGTVGGRAGLVLIGWWGRVVLGEDCGCAKREQSA